MAEQIKRFFTVGVNEAGNNQAPTFHHTREEMSKSATNTLTMSSKTSRVLVGEVTGLYAREASPVVFIPVEFPQANTGNGEYHENAKPATLKSLDF